MTYHPLDDDTDVEIATPGGEPEPAVMTLVGTRPDPCDCCGVRGSWPSCEHLCEPFVCCCGLTLRVCLAVMGFLATLLVAFAGMYLVVAPIVLPSIYGGESASGRALSQRDLYIAAAVWLAYGPLTLLWLGSELAWQVMCWAFAVRDRRTLLRRWLLDPCPSVEYFFERFGPASTANALFGPPHLRYGPPPMRGPGTYINP